MGTESVSGSVSYLPSQIQFSRQACALQADHARAHRSHTSLALGVQHSILLLGISSWASRSTCLVWQGHSSSSSVFDCQRPFAGQFRSVNFGTSQLRDPKLISGCVMRRDQMFPVYALVAQHVVVLLGISQQCEFIYQNHSP